MEELMLKIDNVSKRYRLGQIGGTTLRDEIKRKAAKMLGKEDPTKKIGAKDYKSGETFLALDGISFTVNKGDAIGIIGHNGAGKSTLLKLITRVTAPTDGTISLNGRVASMLEVGTGFHPELTGRENIYMNGAILGMTKREIDAKMDDIIKFSECEKFIDTPVKRYSSGMYVKLAFSVAANLDSEIMIMDEVLAVGDMAFQGKCINKMKQIADSGRTILYVSHNMNTIRQLCNRCIVLDKGHLIYDGEVDTAIAYYLNNVTRKNVHYDLTKAEQNTDTTHELQMNSLTLNNKDVNIYRTGETIESTLTIKTDKEYKGVKLLTVIMRKDLLRIGMTESNLIDLPKGESSIDFTINTENLVDGMYFAELSIINNDKTGSYHKYEGIYDAFDFVIENKKPLRLNREWRSDIFGNVVFPMIEARVQDDR